MTPEFSYRHAIGRAEWPEPYRVALVFEMVRQDRRTGEFAAGVTARSLGGDAEVSLGRDRVILTGSRSKTDFARKVAGRTPELASDTWATLLEAACELMIQAVREGDPPILLRDAEKPMDGGYALPPLVLARHPTIFFGDGGTAKSYLALAAAHDLHVGTTLLGIRPALRTRVAYLDWEFDAWEHRDRLERLTGPDLADVLYVRCVGPLRDQVDRLRRIFSDHAIGWIVIDSIGMACDGPPEDAASALGFWDALRQLGVGALCIAHVNRGGDTERPFGSAFWHNGARSTWYVKKHAEAGARSLSVGLFNRKANTGPLAHPLGFTFTFEDDRTLISRTDVRDVPELAGALALKDRMAHALAAGALTYGELADILESDAESIGRIARRYSGSRFVLIPGLDGKRRVALAHPDTVRPDTPDTVRPVTAGGRTDTPGLIKPVSGPLSGPVREKDEEEEDGYLAALVKDPPR